MDETGDHHVKQNKPSSERQILHIFSHMQNLDLKRTYIYGTIWGKQQEVERGKER
jgi:hypothetical protein